MTDLMTNEVWAQASWLTRQRYLEHMERQRRALATAVGHLQATAERALVLHGVPDAEAAVEHWVKATALLAVLPIEPEAAQRRAVLADAIRPSFDRTAAPHELMHPEAHYATAVAS